MSDSWLSGFGDPSWINTGSIGGENLFPEPVAPLPMPAATSPSGPIVDQDLANNIVRIAQELNISPKDLATVISYETAGTFDPWKAGPRTQWGQHRGLIQWGEPQAKQYGVSKDSSIAQQMDAVKAYLLDRGFKPGGSMMDLYSTINAGAPGLSNRSDANNGGAPGTVADKVNNQMAGHAIKAALLLEGKWKPEGGFNNAVARPSMRQLATSGALGPQAQQDFIDQVPRSPAAAPAGASPVAAELHSLMPSSADEGSPPLPDPSEFDALMGGSNYPVPLDMPKSAPTWLERLTSAARGLSMDTGEFIVDQGSQAKRNLGQVAAKAQGGLTGLPFYMAGALPAMGAAIGGMGGGEEPYQVDVNGEKQFSRKAELTKLLEGAASTMMEQGQKQQQAADYSYGAGDPKDAGEQLGATIGRNIIGGPAMGAIGTAVETVVPPALNALIPPAQAQRKLTQAELVAMGMKPSGQANAALPGPRVSHTIYNTPAGPMTLPQNSFGTLGMIGALTLGFAVGPKVMQNISRTRQPTFTPVENAAAGTMKASSAGDLAKVYHDVYAPLWSIGKKWGVNPQALQDIESAYRIQSGSSARNLVHTALQTGRMETPTFQFRAPPMAKIVEASKGIPQWNDYVKAMALRDELLFRQNQIAGKRATRNYTKPVANQEVATAIDTTTDMAQTLRVINSIEQGPNGQAIRKLFPAYQANIKETRKFLGDGEYSLLSAKDLRELNQNFKGSMLLSKSLRTTVLNKFQLGEDGLALTESHMHRLMRKRMENENTGMYIDAMRARDPRSYTPVDKNWMKQHGKAAMEAGTVVSFYRRGKKEFYTTDPLLASIHRMDPYYFTGGVSQAFYTAKKVFETSTTGALAPFFVPTSAIRSYQIAKINSGEGKAPSLFGTLMAVPRQLGPQIANSQVVRSMADRLDSASGGWLSSVSGAQNHQALSQRLGDYYERTFYAYMQRSGGHQGSFLQASNLQQTKLDELIGQMSPGWGKDFVHAWKQMLDSGHNAAAFAYARKNKDKWLAPELGMRARALTGDPTRSGQAYINSRREPIRFQSDSAGQAAAERVARGYGWVTEQGRNAVPWWNITTQGMRKIGNAYLENPVKFTAMVWMTQMAPTAALYAYTKSLGPEYVEHKYERRSPYARLMNHYVPIPGQPPEKGMEIPRVHEFSFFNALMDIGMDHAFGRPINPQGEDWTALAKSFVGLMDPPMPPLMNLGLASQGMGSPSGIIGTMLGPLAGAAVGTPFGGEAFKRRQEPFDQLGGMNATAEMMMRALAPGITDIVASSYAAASQDPNKLTKGITAMQAGVRRTGEKAPIVRDVIGWQPPVSGNTQINTELLDKSKAIRNLSDYYKKNVTNEGQINIQPQSVTGGALAKEYLGPGLPAKPSNEVYKGYSKSGAVPGDQKPGKWADRIGLKQPEATNPLFKAFADRLLVKFNKDEPEKGGFGYKSMWRMYGDMTESLRTLSKTNAGNLVTWQLALSQKPELLTMLRDAKVDTKNPTEVKNFLTIKRQDYGKKMLFAVRAVEEEFNKIPEVRQALGGKPFRIEDMDPYRGYNRDAGPDFEPGQILDGAP